MSLKLRPIIFIGQLKLFYQHLKTINAWYIPTKAKAEMPATLHGYISSNLPPGGTNLVVRFFTPGTQTEVMKACSPTDASGYFTIYGITPGTYDVGIKNSGSLSNLVASQVFTGGNITEVDFGAIRMGDLTNDDWVTAQDRSILYVWYGLSGDCNGYPGNWLMP